MIDRVTEYELTNVSRNRFMSVTTMLRRFNEVIDTINDLQTRVVALETRWNDLQGLGSEMRDVARELSEVGDALEAL